ncbi:N-acetylneuraminate synthase [Qipengyuania citrea]|nr:N-acetylneuraminate synthase [Qipengyuania citrea]MDQ0567355.1 N-acetylneuraminate synthase [Qipengyuania citrea]
MTLIIAEAGVNHNGDMGMARELVAIAAEAGADMVKFQTFSACEIATGAAPKAGYQLTTTGAEQTQQEMLAMLELSRDDHDVLLRACEEAGIAFFSTGFDEGAIDLLIELGVDRIKVPSGEITNLPLLRHMAAKGLPIILSTGMANLGEIEAAVNALERGGISRNRITILHCNTEYPTPMSEVNLMAMSNIGAAFGTAYGYSDHTKGIEVSIAAVALGASVIEKHFTLDRSLPGPDHAASLEPAELAQMVRAIRNIEQALAGDGIKRPSGSEAGNRAIVRKSIVASRDIAAGELFSPTNLGTKRPGNGISPMRWDELIGCPAPRAFAADELVNLLATKSGEDV